MESKYWRIGRTVLILSVGAAAAFAQNVGYNPQYTGSGNGCKSGGTCYYVDYVNGSDNNNGTSKATPWKTAPGMTCATGNSASHAYSQTDQIIFKGGVTWPSTCFPWTINSGSASVANGSGYPGLYIGYDPVWNAGTVTSVRVLDPGSCAAGAVLSVSLSGGGGNGAAATASLETDPYAAGDLEYANVTNAGSGYTSNPSVSFTVTSGSCKKLPTAYADISSPMMDGSGTIYGTSSSIPIIFTISANYATVDHLEFKHFLWYNGSTYSGGSPNLIFSSGSNQEFRNLFVHDFGMAGPAVAANLVGARNAAQTAAISGCAGYNGPSCGAGTVLTNSIFNNFESEAHGCTNGYTGTCTSNTAIYDIRNVTNNIINAWRAGVYTTAVLTSGYLVAGNKIWAILCDPATQHPDAVYLMGGTIVYNNILRDIFNGTAAFYIETSDGSSPAANGMTTYLFNNVMFGIGTNGAGTSTPPIGWTSEFVSGGATSFNALPDLRAYNNTFYSNAGNTNCINAGQWFGASVALNASFSFTLQNNHCISDQSAGHWYASPTGNYGKWNGQINPNILGTQSLIDPTALVQSPTTASGQGYVASNNFAPTSPNSSTVTFSGTNLTSLCSTSVGGISLGPLCKDINGNPRPTTGGWQSGAYQGAAAQQVVAPPTSPTGTAR